MRSRLLCISGRPENVRMLSRMVQSLPVSLEYAETLRVARPQLLHQRYDAVVTESNLPDGNWLDVLHLVRDSPYETPLIVTDPNADSRFWSEVLNLGAYDVLTQPFYEPEVRRILYNACTRDVPSAVAL
jgi:DNA-binding NtrC family response regulator